MQAKDEAWLDVEPAAKKIDGARRAAEAAARAIREAISAPPRKADASATILDGEIRRWLSGLNTEQRSLALNKAIETGEDAIIAAVLAGPPALSGMADHREADDYRLAWQLARYPAEMDRLSRLEKAVADTERAGSLLIGFMGQLTDSDVLAKAEESERAATAALQSIVDPNLN